MRLKYISLIIKGTISPKFHAHFSPQLESSSSSLNVLPACPPLSLSPLESKGRQRAVAFSSPSRRGPWWRPQQSYFSPSWPRGFEVMVAAESVHTLVATTIRKMILCMILIHARRLTTNTMDSIIRQSEGFSTCYKMSNINFKSSFFQVFWPLRTK